MSGCRRAGVAGTIWALCTGFTVAFGRPSRRPPRGFELPIRIKAGDHFLGVNGGAHHEDIARYSVAWLKIYLEDDTRYETYIYGADQTASIFSTWEVAPK